MHERLVADAEVAWDIATAAILGVLGALLLVEAALLHERHVDDVEVVPRSSPEASRPECNKIQQMLFISFTSGSLMLHAQRVDILEGCSARGIPSWE